MAQSLHRDRHSGARDHRPISRHPLGQPVSELYYRDYRTRLLFSCSWRIPSPPPDSRTSSWDSWHFWWHATLHRVDGRVTGGHLYVRWVERSILLWRRNHQSLGRNPALNYQWGPGP